MPMRVHGAFVSDDEVHRVVEALRARARRTTSRTCSKAPRTRTCPGLESSRRRSARAQLDGEQDPLYDQAVRIVTETRKASISGVQRRLKIGYNRAARMVETMEEAGIVGSLQTNGFREVLAPPPPGVD